MPSAAVGEQRDEPAAPNRSDPHEVVPACGSRRNHREQEHGMTTLTPRQKGRPRRRRSRRPR